MAAAIFDVDGTLIAGSSERLFIAHLAKRGLLRGRQVAGALGFMFARGPIYGLDTPRKNKAYLSGLKVEMIRSLARDFAAIMLVGRLRPEVVERLEAHRGRGEGLALLSGAPDFLVAPLAEHFGIDHWRATRCAEADGRFLPRPPVVHPYAGAKVSEAEALCAALGVGLSDCAAYADSRHDLDLLARTGRPVAVYPDRGLRRAARMRGWTILPHPGSTATRNRFSEFFRPAS